MAGLFQGLFQGKPNRPDFTPDMLPKNRYELFFTTLKLNFFNLIKLNFIYLLFTIPLWVWLWMNYMVLLNLIATAADAQAMLQTVSEFFTQGQFTLLLMGLVPCVMLLGPAKAALKYVTRNWARDEHAYVWSDFWDAFKANWKQGLALSSLNAAVMFLGLFGLNFYAVMGSESTLYVALQTLLVVLLVLYLFINLYAWPMMVTYEMRFSDILRNSLIMAVGRLPFSLLYLLITLVPVAICAFFPPFVLYYFVIGYAFHAFLNVSYTNGAFDKYLNTRIEGAEVGKGLRKEEEDEYEYVDIDEDEEDEDGQDGKRP